jgi:hypothetical protein
LGAATYCRHCAEDHDRTVACQSRPSSRDGATTVRPAPSLRMTVALLSAIALSAACRSKAPQQGAGPANSALTCPTKEAPDPVAAWSARFPIERGGLLVLLDDSAAAVDAKVRQWQSSAGIEGVVTSPCGTGTAVWTPGVDCPEPASIREDLARLAPALFSRCFPVMHADEIVDACARGSLAARTCAVALPPLAAACRPAASTRCQRLASLVGRYPGDAP